MKSRVLILGVVLAVWLGMVGQAAPAGAHAPHADSSSLASLDFFSTFESVVGAAGVLAALEGDPAADVAALRDEYSRATVTESGEITREVFAVPINYRDRGLWTPIDNSLIPATEDGYATESAANSFTAMFPDDAGEDPVRVERSNDWLSFATVGSDGPPVVEDSSATYEGPAGTDVTYIVDSIGIKEQITLPARPTSEATYTYRLDLSDGLEPQLLDSGGVRVLTAGGSVAYEIPAPVMVDSIGTASDDITVDLVPTDGGWKLQIIPDESWLGDAARSYPVLIDPTVTVKTAAFDCYLTEATPSTSNCGADRLQVGLDTNGKARRALVAFDLSKYPTAATVSSATLQLFNDPDQRRTDHEDRYVAGRVTRPWTTAATWTTSDGSTAWTTPGGDFTGSVDGPLLTGKVDGYKSFPVTSMVQMWLSDPATNLGAMIKQKGEAGDNRVSFVASDSYDTEQLPKLVMSYTAPPPAVPTSIAVTPCDSNCTGTPVVATATPTVATRSSDAKDAFVDYEFELKAPSGDVIQLSPDQARVQQVPAADTAYWVIPPGAIGTSGVYSVRVLAKNDTAQSAWSGYVDFQVAIGDPKTTSTEHPAIGGNTVTGPVVWRAEDSPHVVSSTISVQPGGTLTIEPGTVVKFMENGSLSLAGGQLVADGSATAPIVFTSYEDDSVAGDTNGTTAEPPPIRVLWVNPTSLQAQNSATSIVDNVAFMHGGDDTGNCRAVRPFVDIGQYGRIEISHSTFAYLFETPLRVAPMPNDVGTFTLRNTQVFDTLQGCGVEIEAGDVFENVFDEEIFTTGATPQLEATYESFSSGAVSKDAHVKLWRNVFKGAIKLENSSVPITRDMFDFNDNAFMGGWQNNRGDISNIVEDISNNYWPSPSAAGQCWPPTENPNDNPIPTSGSNEFPQPDLYVGPYSVTYGCYLTGPTIEDVGNYWTDVQPFAARAEFPDAGLEALPAIPWVVAPEYRFGDGGEFGNTADGDQADPVNSATGSYTDVVLDAALPNPGVPVTVARTYNSADITVGVLGRGWSFGYDAKLDTTTPNVAVFKAGDGQQMTFTRTSPTDPWTGGTGVTAKLASTGTTYNLTTRGQTTYSFDSTGKLTAIRDRFAQGVALHRNANGQIDAANGLARTITFEYWPSGRLKRATQPDGRHVDYGYDPTDNVLTSVTDLDGNTTQYGYVNSRLETVTNPLNQATLKIAYDTTSGRVSDQWTPDKDGALTQHTTFAWNANTETSVMTDPRGKVWVDDYDNGLLVKRTDPLNRAAAYRYDDQLRLNYMRNARGDYTRFTYNTAGDATDTTGPLGHVHTNYNNRHDPIESINAKGTTTRYGYDTDGFCSSVQVILPVAHKDDIPVTYTDTYTRNTRGQIRLHTDARNKTTEWIFNSYGDIASVTDPLTNKTAYTYDLAGRVATITAPEGYQAGNTPTDYRTSLAYQDGPVATVTSTDPLGHGTTATYDQAGRLTTATDASSHTTTYTYFPNDLVKAVQGPNSAIPPIQYSYDANANLTKVIDSSNRQTTYAYDSDNQISDVTTPTGAYSYTYDKLGHQATATASATGQTTAMTYNAAGLLKTITYPDDTNPSIAFTYDIHGNRTQMSDQSGTPTTYQYNAIDQLVTVTRGTRVFTYTYTATGAIKTATGPSGSHTYIYTDSGLLKTATYDDTPTTLATYTYTPSGQPKTATLTDGSTWTASYDRAGQLTNITDKTATNAVLLNDTITRDPVGNPTQIVHNGGSTDTYAYDNLDRLTDVCYTSATCPATGSTDYIHWTYDDSGNRTTEVRPAGTATYTYNPNTGLLQSVTGPGAANTTYSYDALGRLRTRGNTTYDYTPANQISSQTTGAATTTFGYDGDQRMLTAATSGVTTYYAWDPLTHQLDQQITSNTPIKYHRALGTSGYRTSNTEYTLHTDLQGSIRRITSGIGSGTTIATASYEPYGLLRSQTGTNATPLGWAGEATTTDGTIHLRARRYDPTTGAFATPDPLGTGSDTYVYGAANPMRYADPYGLAPGGNKTTVNTTSPGVNTIATAGPSSPVASARGPLAALSGASAALTTVAYNPYATTGLKGAQHQAIINGNIEALVGAAATVLPGVGLGSRAARRAAMREAGIPTSMQWTRQVRTPAGYSYVYRVNGEIKVVSDQTTDRVLGHLPHWEAGTAKDPIRFDPFGRIRVRNDKAKFEYDE